MAKTPGPVAGSLGNTDYYYKSDGTVVDENGIPASARIAAMFAAPPVTELLTGVKSSTRSSGETKTNPPDPEVEVQKVKKRTKGLKRVIAAKIGNSKYYHDPLTGAIVDEQGQPAPKRIAEQLLNDKVTTTAKTPPRKTQSIPELAKLKKELAGLRKLNAKLIKIIKKNNSSTSATFELFQTALTNYATRNSELLEAMSQQTANFQEKVVELLTGVKSPTRSSGETKTNAPTSRPKKGKASRFKKTQSKYQRRVAVMTAAQKKAHSDRVQSRAEQIAAIRLKANVGTVVKSGLVGAVGGVIAGSAIAALLAGRKEPPKPNLDALNARTLGPTGGNIPTQRNQTRVEQEEQEAARTLPPTTTPPAGTPTQQTALPAPTVIQRQTTPAPSALPAPTVIQRQPPGTPTRQGGTANISEISQYIVSKASEMGVNPYLALGIAAGEGLNRNTIGHPTFGNRDARGYSFGPYQLYSASPDPTKIAPGGMAMEFLQKYNEPPNASNWRKQVDFSLEVMKRRGPAGLERGPWYAVRDRGGVANITNQGTQYARQQGITPGAIAPEATAPAANAPGGAGGLGTPTGGTASTTGAAPAAGGTPTGGPAMLASSTPGAGMSAGDKTGENGKLPADRLAPVGIGQHKAQPVAAEAFKAMRAAAVADRVDLGITDSYRSYAAQVDVKRRKPNLAATPGRSNHGWGLAFDMSFGSNMNTPAYKWMVQNAAKFGFKGPLQRPFEAWHWEYVGGGNPEAIKAGGNAMAAAPGAPAAAPGASTAVQGTQMANESTERAIAQGSAPTGGRMIVMNNTETINNTQIINRSDSLPRGNRRNEGFNPLQVFADALIGKANSRVF